MKLLGLSGSLRAASTNSQMLRALRLSAPTEMSIDVYDRLGELPPFSPDGEADTPEPVLHLAGAVAESDGLLIACPEYAHGIPGAFKNALDWLVSRSEIPGKPVMLVHASTRSDHARRQLREVLSTMSCRLFSGSEFEIHLIKKSGAEIDAIMAAPETGEAVRAKLREFARFASTEY